MKKLEGKVAIVTASTKGIGLASAQALAREGATVYLAARSQELANEVIAEMKKKGEIVYLPYGYSIPGEY